jgi:hypothetical protein
MSEPTRGGARRCHVYCQRELLRLVPPRPRLREEDIFTLFSVIYRVDAVLDGERGYDAVVEVRQVGGPVQGAEA